MNNLPKIKNQARCFKKPFLKMLILQMLLIIPGIIFFIPAFTVIKYALIITIIYLVVQFRYNRNEATSLGISLAFLAPILPTYLLQEIYYQIRHFFQPNLAALLPYEWYDFSEILLGFYLVHLAIYTFVFAMFCKSKNALAKTFRQMLTLQVIAFTALLLIWRIYSEAHPDGFDYQNYGNYLLLGLNIITLLYLAWQFKFKNIINWGLPLAFAFMPLLQLIRFSDNFYRLIDSVLSFFNLGLVMPYNSDAHFYESTLFLNLALKYYAIPFAALTGLICLIYIKKQKRS